MRTKHYGHGSNASNFFFKNYQRFKAFCCRLETESFEFEQFGIQQNWDCNPNNLSLNWAIDVPEDLNEPASTFMSSILKWKESQRRDRGTEGQREQEGENHRYNLVCIVRAKNRFSWRIFFLFCSIRWKCSNSTECMYAVPICALP